MNYENGNERQDEVYSKSIRAGKRTYFFDIKATRGNDFYLTLTESKKNQLEGKNSFQKHKLFLYKEDFDKFIEGLQEVIDKARELQAQYPAEVVGVPDVTFEEL
jgi:hypothetical protein